MSGGAVLHEDGLTLSQPLGNTNILVKAPGAADVAVSNHKGIKTDSRGYAVILTPRLTALTAWSWM